MNPDKHLSKATTHPSPADHETRRHILETAETLFIERGFKGVSMKEIADVVRVTPAALYYHFPQGKDEIFVETIRQFLGEMVERAFQRVESASDFRTRLVVLTQNILGVPINRLEPLLLDGQEHLRNTKPELMAEIASTFGRRATRIFQEAIDAGEIGNAVPADLLMMFHQGMCIALLNRHQFRGEEFSSPHDEPRLAEQLVAVLLDGVGPAPPASATP